MGELHKKIVSFGFTAKGKPLEIYQEHLNLVLGEARSEFPKPVFYDHPEKGEENTPCNDPEEFYRWFKKWFD
jgi:hypothetical protein